MAGSGAEIEVRSQELPLKPTLPLLLELANNGFSLDAIYDNPVLGIPSVGTPLFDKASKGGAKAFRVPGVPRPDGVADLCVYQAKGAPFEFHIQLTEPVSEDVVHHAAEAVQMTMGGRKHLQGRLGDSRAIIVDTETAGRYGRVRVLTTPIWDGAPNIRAPFRRALSMLEHLLDPEGIPAGQAPMTLLTVEPPQDIEEILKRPEKRYDVRAMDHEFLSRTHHAKLLGPVITTLYHLFNQPARPEAMVTASIPGRRNAVRAERWLKSQRSQYTDERLWTIWPKGLPGISMIYTQAASTEEPADGIIKINFDRQLAMPFIAQQLESVATEYGVSSSKKNKGPYLELSLDGQVVVRTPHNQTARRNWHLLPAKNGDYVVPSAPGVALIEALYREGVRKERTRQLMGGLELPPRPEPEHPQVEMYVTRETAEMLERYAQKRRAAYHPETLQRLGDAIPDVLRAV